MRSQTTGYGVYLEFYTGLAEGRPMSSKDFCFSEQSPIGYSETGFDEEQAASAVLAIEDFKKGLPRRNKKSFLKQLAVLLDD